MNVAVAAFFLGGGSLYKKESIHWKDGKLYKVDMSVGRGVDDGCNGV